MSSAKDLFLSVTQHIFSNWTALRMAVEHGMGTKDRAIDFCSYITEVMYMNDDLNSSEIAMELEEYMDECFNTELEDGSAIQVAEELLKFYRFCRENNTSALTAELEKSPLQSWLFTRNPVRNVRNTSVTKNDSSEEEETSNNMEVIDE